MKLQDFIRDVPNFPREGVIFKDITPLLQNVEAFRYAVDQMAEPYKDRNIQSVVAIEARGFIFGAPIAYNLGASFVPVRKMGKLPAESINVEYSLEYGTTIAEMHRDGVTPGTRVLVVDDLLATGGTLAAAIELVERLGGEITGVVVLVELRELDGRRKLEGYEVTSLLKF